MSYYNHFSERKYQQIFFKDVPLNGKFRQDLFCGKRRRKDIIMIKKSENSYIEQKSKVLHELAIPEKMIVSSFDKLNHITAVKTETEDRFA